MADHDRFWVVYYDDADVSKFMKLMDNYPDAFIPETELFIAGDTVTQRYRYRREALDVSLR